jgi:hypothetical protein
VDVQERAGEGLRHRRDLEGGGPVEDHVVPALIVEKRPSIRAGNVAEEEQAALRLAATPEIGARDADDEAEAEPRWRKIGPRLR